MQIQKHNLYLKSHPQKGELEKPIIFHIVISNDNLSRNSCFIIFMVTDHWLLGMLGLGL